MVERERRLLASFSLLSMSCVGVRCSSRPPHSLITSSLSLSCHSGCVLSRNMAQVSRCEVVSCPAKKKVLHSSMISPMLSSWGPPSRSGLHASSISPSRSFPYPALSLAASLALMICMSVVLASLSSFHTLRFFFVGRYLQK
jgi:hypothetical protein